MKIPIGEFVENRILEIGEGIFIRQAVDNCLWADLGEGAVVVDTLEDPLLAPRIEEKVRETTGLPVKWVINTHWDIDHIAGNAYFAQKGATIIAHHSCAPASAKPDGNPNVVFEERYLLQSGNRGVEIEWLGGTHTPADSVVYFPWAKVLHVADLFGWGLFMQRQINPQQIQRTQQILDRLLQYDAEVIVCGHGPLLTLEHLRRFKDYYHQLIQEVPSLKRRGLSLDQVEESLPPPEDMKTWWRFVDWKHHRNLERLYEAL